MTLTSVLFFLIGAIFLWGGFAITLAIALRDRDKD